MTWVSISKPKLFAMAIILLVGSTAFYFGQVLATSAPTRNTTIEPGWSQFCSWNIYLDGTTPVAHPGSGGTNLVGTAGQDMGTFLTTGNGLIGNNLRDCVEAGTYTFTVQILATGIQSFFLVGRGNGTIFKESSSWPNSQDLLKFINCGDVGVSYIQFQGNNAKTGGALVSAQNCKGVTIDHIVGITAPDGAVWLCGDNGNVIVTRSIFHDNGNPTSGPTQFDGGLEIDANSCTGGPNNGVIVSDSVSYHNFGPGFAVDNCGGSTTSPCAGGTHPNSNIIFQDDISYNAQNITGTAFPPGYGFSTFSWNTTQFINCRTYGNAVAGFGINGATNGPLTIIAQSADTVPFKLLTTLATPKYDRIQIAYYNPTNTNMNGGGFAAILNNANVTTSSSSRVSTGVGVSSVFPQITGNMFVTFSSTVSSTVAGLIEVGVYRTTGGVPSAGTAATGSAEIAEVSYDALANQRISISGSILDNGGTLFTSYAWYIIWDVKSGGGTATLWQFTASLIVNEV